MASQDHNKYSAPSGPPPNYSHSDAGPYYNNPNNNTQLQPYNEPLPPSQVYYANQNPGYASPPPQGFYGGNGPAPDPNYGGYYGARGPQPQQGYYPQQQPMYYAQQPMYGPPAGGYYADQRGYGSSAGGGICAGLLGALACCCCLDLLI